MQVPWYAQYYQGWGRARLPITPEILLFKDEIGLGAEEPGLECNNAMGSMLLILQ